MEELIDKILDALITKAAAARLDSLLHGDKKLIDAWYEKMNRHYYGDVGATPAPAPAPIPAGKPLSKAELAREKKREYARRWYQKMKARKATHKAKSKRKYHDGKDPGLAAAEANARSVRTADDIP
ncbi:MAG TPA: hypothetical protein PLL10_04865 [Elusimicrobiales bacterium]|nr:hypothetical protein [Elusimicrobiales bacterium]